MSNETKWTPGPWRVILNSYEHPAVQRGNEGGFVVKGVSKNRETADAHLIAAAPELYSEIEALLSSYRQLAKDYEYASGTGDIHPAHQERIERAMSVMAKARGEL